MAGYDGLGNYILRYNFQQDAAAGIKILAVKQDAMWTDVAAGFGNCLTRDGQGKPSGDIDWNGHKITGLAPATGSTDAAQFQQVQGISSKNQVNPIENSCFSVWQRGAPITPAAAGAYAADRWYLRRLTGAAAGIRATQNAGDTGNPFFTAIGFGRESGDVASTEEVWLSQAIETINAKKLISYQNRTTGIVTVVSAYLRKGSTLPDSTITLRLQSANLADAAPWGAATWLTDGSLVINSSTLSTTVYTRVFFVVDGASFFGSSSLKFSVALANVEATAGADSLLYATGIKVEQMLGTAESSPTQFEPLDYTLDLHRCQRYYQVYGGATSAIIFSGYATSTGSGLFDHTLLLPVTMFRVPTATKNGTWAVANCGQPSVVTATPSSIVLRVTVQATAYTSFVTDSAEDTVTLDAELTA